MTYDIGERGKDQTVKVLEGMRPSVLIEKLSFEDFIYLLLERGEGRGKERERNIYLREKHWLPLARTLTWEQTQNLGMYPRNRRNRPGLEAVTLCFVGQYPAS